VNVKEALVILKGQNSALGFQNLTVGGVCRVSNFESLLLVEFCPFRIDPPMEPEQERLSKLYSGSGIHSLPELNPNLNLHLKRQPVQNIFLHIYSWVDFDQF
jgi:hypothetical protein